MVSFSKSGFGGSKAGSPSVGTGQGFVSSQTTSSSPSGSGSTKSATILAQTTAPTSAAVSKGAGDYSTGLRPQNIQSTGQFQPGVLSATSARTGEIYRTAEGAPSVSARQTWENIAQSSGLPQERINTMRAEAGMPEPGFVSTAGTRQISPHYVSMPRGQSQFIQEARSRAMAGVAARSPMLRQKLAEYERVQEVEAKVEAPKAPSPSIGEKFLTIFKTPVSGKSTSQAAIEKAAKQEKPSNNIYSQNLLSKIGQAQQAQPAGFGIAGQTAKTLKAMYLSGSPQAAMTVWQKSKEKPAMIIPGGKQIAEISAQTLPKKYGEFGFSLPKARTGTMAKTPEYFFVSEGKARVQSITGISPSLSQKLGFTVMKQAAKASPSASDILLGTGALTAGFALGTATGVKNVVLHPIKSFESTAAFAGSMITQPQTTGRALAETIKAAPGQTLGELFGTPIVLGLGLKGLMKAAPLTTAKILNIPSKVQVSMEAGLSKEGVIPTSTGAMLLSQETRTIKASVTPSRFAQIFGAETKVLQGSAMRDILGISDKKGVVAQIGAGKILLGSKMTSFEEAIVSRPISPKTSQFFGEIRPAKAKAIEVFGRTTQRKDIAATLAGFRLKEGQIPLSIGVQKAKTIIEAPGKFSRADLGLEITPTTKTPTMRIKAFAAGQVYPEGLKMAYGEDFFTWKQTKAAPKTQQPSIWSDKSGAILRGTPSHWAQVLLDVKPGEQSLIGITKAHKTLSEFTKTVSKRTVTTGTQVLAKSKVGGGIGTVVGTTKFGVLVRTAEGDVVTFQASSLRAKPQAPEWWQMGKKGQASLGFGTEQVLKMEQPKVVIGQQRLTQTPFSPLIERAAKDVYAARLAKSLQIPRLVMPVYTVQRRPQTITIPKSIITPMSALMPTQQVSPLQITRPVQLTTPMTQQVTPFQITTPKTTQTLTPFTPSITMSSMLTPPVPQITSWLRVLPPILSGETRSYKGKKPKRMWKPSVIAVEKGVFGRRQKYESGLGIRPMPSSPAMKKMWGLVHGAVGGSFGLQRPGMSKKVALRANQYYKMSDLMYKPNKTVTLPRGAKNYVNFLGNVPGIRKLRRHLGL